VVRNTFVRESTGGPNEDDPNHPRVQGSSVGPTWVQGPKVRFAAKNKLFEEVGPWGRWSTPFPIFYSFSSFSPDLLRKGGPTGPRGPKPKTRGASGSAPADPRGPTSGPTYLGPLGLGCAIRADCSRRRELAPPPTTEKGAFRGRGAVSFKSTLLRQLPQESRDDHARMVTTIHVMAFL